MALRAPTRSGPAGQPGRRRPRACPILARPSISIVSASARRAIAPRKVRAAKAGRQRFQWDFKPGPGAQTIENAKPWNSHKVHHSAEVMATLTELRQHPVEIIAFMNWIGLTTGIVFGVMTYAFGPGVRPFTLLNGNILTMVFLLTYGHLRHSHMWIAFTGIAGRILQSPAHHQLHHSANPVHFDKNLGFALALWDWAFGTLAIPAKTREPIVFGIGDEGAPFRSTLSALVAPCARAAGHMLRPVQRIAAERAATRSAQTPP